MKRRFCLTLFAFLALAIPIAAHAQNYINNGQWNTNLRWEKLSMRNTTAAAIVPVITDWTRENTQSFTDSILFRRGATTMTVYDTTKAYSTGRWGLTPNIGRTATSSVLDSTDLPWLIVRVRQDSLRTANDPLLFTGTSGLDSVRVGAEYSNDGVNWFSCPGTPTYRFDVVFFTSGQDGLQNPSLVGVEASPGEDQVYIPLRCSPAALAGNSFIVNRTLCMTGSFIRFIVGGDYSGQFMVEVAGWREN